MTCTNPAATHCNLHWWCFSSTNQAFTDVQTYKWALVLQLALCDGGGGVNIYDIIHTFALYLVVAECWNVKSYMYSFYGFLGVKRHVYCGTGCTQRLHITWIDTWIYHTSTVCEPFSASILYMHCVRLCACVHACVRVLACGPLSAVHA